MGVLPARSSFQKGGWYKHLVGSTPIFTGYGLFYLVLGVASCAAALYLSIGHLGFRPIVTKLDFVGRDGKHFMVDGKVFYVNGWNSYWLMDQAVDTSTRSRVREMFQAGAEVGLTVCRTWAFNDGTYNALQVSLGRFDERVFKALDIVITEARKNGIRLLLSLVNNLQAFGGKTQYVKWAWEDGISLTSSNDSFFFDPSIRSYFKLYVKTILTRKNHLTGVEYRDDPTIFAWELMNEPQCLSDATGDTLQSWIEEMAGYVKSIDNKHLLTIGLEGFYGPSSPPAKQEMNPGQWYATIGTDFIRNSRIREIDFASVHIYPDHWLLEAELGEKKEYASKFMRSHIEDCDGELGKPILFSEFGLSNKNKNFNYSQRDAFYRNIYDTIYNSARKKGAGAGALIWQFLVRGMNEYNDEFGEVPGDRPSLYGMIRDQSCRLAELNSLRVEGREASRGIC